MRTKDSAPRQLDPTRPFTYAAARAAGITRRQLSGPEFRRIFTGVYIAASMRLDTYLCAAAALLIAPPEAFVARHTAARLWGAVPPDDWRTHICTLAPDVWTGGGAPADSRWRRTRVDGIDSRSTSDDTRIVRFKGLWVSDPIRTFLDLAGDLDLVELVVLGDSLVRNTHIRPADLIAAAATPGRFRRRARRAAALVREGVDSPQESRLRMLIVLAGLPEPRTNILLRDAHGRVVRRLDLGYEEFLIAAEYDGRQHAEDAQQWQGDIARREELDDRGWRLLVILAQDLYTNPETVLDRLVTLLHARGCRDAAVTSTEWRRYFGPEWLRRSA